MEIYDGHYHALVSYVISKAIARQLVIKADAIETDFKVKTNFIVENLTNGVSVMTYLKLRSLHACNMNSMACFFKKPKMSTPFEVLIPFVLAINQVGIVNVSSLTKELILLPDASPTAAARYLLPTNVTWSRTNYVLAVEFAKKIGVEFSTVDLSVKLRSSWWLYRPVKDRDILTLQCPLPEDNFTESSAVLRTLFLRTDQNAEANEIFNLANIGNHDYGSMLRNPPDDVCVSTYFAVERK